MSGAPPVLQSLSVAVAAAVGTFTILYFLLGPPTIRPDAQRPSKSKSKDEPKVLETQWDEKAGEDQEEEVRFEQTEQPQQVSEQAQQIPADEEQTVEKAAEAESAAAFFGVMRHSVRADEDPTADWPDKIARPYDCPIKDYDLPGQQAPQLQAFGFKNIVCSPFRRCLQTAGVVARALNIKSVVVHLGIGEVMQKVKKSIQETDESADLSLQYLETAAMEEALGGGVSISSVDGERPSFDEDPSASLQRLMDTLAHLRAEHASHSTLVVTHGDAVNAAGQLLLGQTTVVYDTQECCWVVFDAAGGLVGNARCQLLQLG